MTNQKINTNIIAAKIAAITMLGLGIGHLIVNIMLIAIGS